MPTVVSTRLSHCSVRSESPKSSRIARTPSIACVATQTRNSTSSTSTRGLRKYVTTSAKSRSPPLAMKCCATRWKPSKNSSPTPVIICQSQLEVALGSCANGFSMFLPPENLQSYKCQHDHCHKHHDAEERFLDAHSYGKAGQRHTQAVEAVNERTSEQDDIKYQDVRRTCQ